MVKFQRIEKCYEAITKAKMPNAKTLNACIWLNVWKFSIPNRMHLKFMMVFWEALQHYNFVRPNIN